MQQQRKLGATWNNKLPFGPALKMVMISVPRRPNELILEQHSCLITPITLSDTITLRGPTHKEGLELEFRAKAKNKHG